MKTTIPRNHSLILLILLTSYICYPLTTYGQIFNSEEHQFYMAVIDGPAEKVAKMLEEGFDPNSTREGSPVTYLMTAANQGNVEIVKLLLEYGADHTVELTDGSTALSFAAQNGRLETVNLLLQLDPSPEQQHLDKALLESARSGHPLTSKALVEAGSRIHSQGQGGLTPLHYAARQGYPETTTMLIDLGADINRPDSTGRTPLMLAAWMAHEQVTRLLLEKGAERNPVDFQGYRAFYGLEEATDWKALLDRHWIKRPVEAEICDRAVGHATIYKPDNADVWRVSGHKLFEKPQEGTEAWIVSEWDNTIEKLKIESVTQNEYARIELNEEAWDVEFEPYDGAAFRSVDKQGAGLMVWPAPETISVVENPDREDLPWGMPLEIARTAVDLDGDNRPDLLEVEFCCSDPLSDEFCEYYCTQYWLKVEGRWIKCDSIPPA